MCRSTTRRWFMCSRTPPPWSLPLSSVSAPALHLVPGSPTTATRGAGVVGVGVGDIARSSCTTTSGWLTTATGRDTPPITIVRRSITAPFTPVHPITGTIAPTIVLPAASRRRIGRQAAAPRNIGRRRTSHRDLDLPAPGHLGPNLRSTRPRLGLARRAAPGPSSGRRLPPVRHRAHVQHRRPDQISTQATRGGRALTGAPRVDARAPSAVATMPPPPEQPQTAAEAALPRNKGMPRERSAGEY